MGEMPVLATHVALRIAQDTLGRATEEKKKEAGPWKTKGARAADKWPGPGSRVAMSSPIVEPKTTLGAPFSRGSRVVTRCAFRWGLGLEAGSNYPLAPCDQQVARLWKPTRPHLKPEREGCIPQRVDRQSVHAGHPLWPTGPPKAHLEM